MEVNLLAFFTRAIYHRPVYWLSPPDSPNLVLSALQIPTWSPLTEE